VRRTRLTKFITYFCIVNLFVLGALAGPMVLSGLMAMVAAHYQTGAVAAERAALRWREELPDRPEIHAPDMEPCGVVTQYVPVNDDTSQFYFKQGKPTFFQEISGTVERLIPP